MAKTRNGMERGPSAWMWVAFIVLSALGFSRAFACATPFAAVATAAAFTLPRRPALATVLLVWLGNQAIGFGLLHYPHTASTFGWGGAIGVAALAALGAARIVGRWVGRDGVVASALALCAAFVAYEAVLLAATGVLPFGSAAFVPMVVLRILVIDVAAFGLLLAAYRLGLAVGLPSSRALSTRRG